MTSYAFYILLITICLAALSGYFFVWRVLGRITSRIIGFLAKTVLIVILLGAAALLAPKYIQDYRPVSASEACKRNCERIVTALDTYAGDHQGKYPPNLSKLVPKYLLTVPTCPAAEKDTYSRLYKVSSDGKRFSLCCGDNNHIKKKYPDSAR